MTRLQIAHPAPEFALPDLDGAVVRLSAFRGQVVLVNFWSAECPWAERVDRALAALDSPALVLLPVASNGTEPPVLLRQAAQERGLPRVLVDAGHEVADQYGAETTPHLFLVDSAGILRYQGAYDDVTFRNRFPTRSYLREALRALERGRDIEIEETPPYGCSIIRFTEP